VSVAYVEGARLCACGRFFSDQNERVGKSCRGCLTEWIERPLDPDDVERWPVAFAVVGESECVACGTPTCGTDLCRDCDDSLPPRLVNV
jgi:hypothetical protein